MSSSVQSAIVNPDTKDGSNEALGQGQPARSVQHKNYKGFVAGVFSGIAKLSGKSDIHFPPRTIYLFLEQLVIRTSQWDPTNFQLLAEAHIHQLRYHQSSPAD